MRHARPNSATLADRTIDLEPIARREDRAHAVGR
jgi:hypothetical protein